MESSAKGAFEREGVLVHRGGLGNVAMEECKGGGYDADFWEKQESMSAL